MSGPCVALATVTTEAACLDTRPVRNTTRQQLQSAYILHQRPYRDTSVLLEVFSQDHGRLGVVAKGVRRRRNPRQALLQPFTPLLLSWSGRGELMTLLDVESQASGYLLQGSVLMSGFYLNELLLRLLQRQDPHSRLFLHYDRTLTRLADMNGQAQQRAELPVALRIFEKYLLEEIGYGLMLDCDAEGEVLNADRLYRYQVGVGLVPLPDNSRVGVEVLHGAHLCALARDQLDEVSARGVKRLLRAAIDQHLGGKPLQSRKMLLEMQRGVASS